MIPLGTIDTSTLISLAKVGEMEILFALAKKIQCPKEVYEECVEEGIYLGYEDAFLIKRYFRKKKIRVLDNRLVKMPGLTRVDAAVLSLALKTNSVLMTNDTKLGRRGTLEDLRVMGSPDLLLLTFKKKQMGEDVYRNKIRLLREKMRLSQENMQFYLEVI